ncbi:T9SS type B sorting domain-containing protein [Pontibacter mangrovi]|uniref:T9SS type B sorting domain-containing protein n=1 Tax=Pontibacter mangrovi TaxID=2589816 RepID=UPI0015E2F159|nr:gliding motility-associated C-terminal domain-containing protein [Pontibacter mangrovi]
MDSVKKLLLLWLVLLSAAAWAQDGCFKAIQNGKEVKAICTNEPVFFQNCTSDPDAVVFYYPGPDKFDPQNYDESDMLTGEQPITYSNPGSYTITQVINREGGGDTKYFEQVFEVRAAILPEFSAQACANGAVTFTVNTPTYDTYIYDFGDGTAQETNGSSAITHTFTSQGTYTVTLTGSYTDVACGRSHTEQVTTLPVLDPDNPIQLNKLTVLEQSAAGSIQLELSGLVPGYTYTVEQFTGDFREPYKEIGVLAGITNSEATVSFENVSTSKGTWYLVRPQDDCGNTLRNSNVVSAIALEVQPNEQLVALKWQSLNNKDFNTYEVYRNGTLLQSLPGTASSFNDADVTCGQNYSYHVVGILTEHDGNTYTSVSAAFTAEVNSTARPAAPYLLSSFNLQNEVELSLQLPTGEQAATIVYERSTGGTTYSTLAESQQLSLFDSESQPRQACYRASFTNTCGNTSAISNITCPILLEAEQKADGSIDLRWSAFTGFPDEVGQYTVELLDEAGVVAATYTADGLSYTDNTLSKDLPVLRYRIKASSANGTGTTYSNLAEIEQTALLYIPSAFTPNGDGLNDVFEIKGKFYTGYTLLVYNRLGNVVYQGTNNDPLWDGTKGGRKLPAGAYAYEITFTTSFGTSKSKTGTITLLR